jgi:HEAT repeat protein
MIQDPAAADGLLEALEDENADVRKQAMWALMRVINSSDLDVDHKELAQKLRRALKRGG